MSTMQPADQVDESTSNILHLTSDILGDRCKMLDESTIDSSISSLTQTTPSAYVVKVSGRLWQITTEILRQLLASQHWQQTSTTQLDPNYHLLLGDRGRVQYAHLVGRKVPPTQFKSSDLRAQQVMVNSYRGCNDLTNKSALCKTMRHFSLEHQLRPEQLDYLPSTFILRPGDSNDERQLFLAEFQFQQQLIQSTSAASSGATVTTLPSQVKNAWIVKANRGAKGSAIFVSDDAEKLIAYVDARVSDKSDDPPATEPTSATNASASTSSDSSNPPSSSTAPSTRPVATGLAARAPPLRSRLALHSRTGSLAVAASDSWVLQRYIDRPFLIHQRKFDIRVWVLLDMDYNIYLYRNGVCRTSSTEFSMANLNDTFVHLTNHCIQQAHPDFNKDIEGNEMFFPQFQSYLDSLLENRLCVICHLLPQFQRVVRDTLLSVRPSMETTGEYSSFQLFGFDFMLTDEFHLRLLEINATPASAEKLLQNMVKHMLERTVHKVYQTNTTEATQSTSSASSTSVASSAKSTIQPSTTSPASILAQPCHCSSIRGKLSKQEYLTPADESINLFDLI